MERFSLITEIRELYRRGENIMRALNNSHVNSKESILISYDFQAGSYVDQYYTKSSEQNIYIDQLLENIKNCGPCSSILEAGIGEATTFIDIKRGCGITHNNCYGFDISWSRLKVASNFLKQEKTSGVQLFVGDLFEIPLSDDSIDLVYTSHSIEPNGGCEADILSELYRITNKFLLLFEPDYNYASDEGKTYMEHHGYIKNLYSTVKNLGYDVVKYQPLKLSRNSLNPTSVIIIRKNNDKESQPIFQCPLTKTLLTDCGDVYFSQDSYLMYPVIQNIPYLLSSHAILGCQYKKESK